jgi:flagellar hook assembly protein FlgD
LGQNYPNPFNLETGMKLGLVKTSDVSLKIYNILGEEVRTLADGRYGPGDYALTWDARDGNGTIVPSGVYFYRLTADDQVVTRKMSLLK